MVPRKMSAKWRCLRNSVRYNEVLLYYNTLEWESRFTSGLNAAKNIDYIEK